MAHVQDAESEQNAFARIAIFSWFVIHKTHKADYHYVKE